MTTQPSGSHADSSASGQLFFNVHPAANSYLISAKPKNLHRPQEIAEFSYDENHEIHLDARSLSYYYPSQPAEPPIDLCKGVETFRMLDDTQDSHLSGLLTAIMDMEKKQNAKTNAHFITYRGMMTNLLTMPYQKFDEWAMNLTFYDGTIFIEEDKPTKLEKKAREQRSADDEKLSYYYGFKFETRFTIPDIWDNVSRDEIESRDDKVVSNHAQYCSIVKTGVGDDKNPSIDIVIGGEVDCIWDAKIEGAKYHKYVELKTTRWIVTDRSHPREVEREQEKYDRRKLKYWAQSYLIGCPKIIVGKKDTANRVHMPLDVFATMRIPATVRTNTRQGRSPVWDSGICVQTFSAFLEWLYNQIKDSNGVWKLSKKRDNFVISLLHSEPSGTGQILTDEFQAHRLELANRMSSEAEEVGGGAGGAGSEDKMNTDT